MNAPPPPPLNLSDVNQVNLKFSSHLAIPFSEPMVALHYFLLSISVWMCNRHLELNVSETEFLIPLLNLFLSVFTPAVYGNAILSVAQAKNLGVIYTLLLFFCLFVFLPSHIYSVSKSFKIYPECNYLLFISCTLIPWSKSLSCIPFII